MTTKANKHIQKFKEYRAPFWARWLGSFKARREMRMLEREALARKHFIATVFHYIWLNEERYAICWYICSQFGDGKRVIEYGTNDPRFDDHTRRCVAYASVIKPWLDGSYTNFDLQEYAKISQKKPTVNPFIKKEE